MSEKKKALTAVKVKADDAQEGVTMIRVHRRVLAVFHQVRKADKLTISDAIERMVIAYVQKHHPDWELCFDDETDG
ncbi:MAG: hypothetical protein RI900_2814 [Actinomycetota bacterium]|jgi:hypothetical protein